eukprot:366000-Chlamydomonas_euryale.AAC.36
MHVQIGSAVCMLQFATCAVTSTAVDAVLVFQGFYCRPRRMAVMRWEQALAQHCVPLASAHPL